MRKRLLIPCAAMLMMASCAGNGGSQESAGDNQQQKADFVSDKEFFEGKDTLPHAIDLSMDISQMSLQRLRYMKAYLYATKNVWLKDLDQNLFFCDRLPGYQAGVYERWTGNGASELSETSDYWEIWSSDYEKALAMEKLSPQEQDFVNRINERMAALLEKKYRSVGGLSLGDPSIAANAFQFPDLYSQDSKLRKALMNSNVAFQTTEYEQLFNVYERNSYINLPNFVTTDVFLQAFHMYFSHTLKVLEVTDFTNALKEFLSETAKSAYYGSTCQEEEQYLDFARAFFAVAAKLIDPDAKIDAPEAIQKIADEEVSMVMKCDDDFSPLMDRPVEFNYSLFKPRGHYTRDNEFKSYFRTMMWLQAACMESGNDEGVKRAIAIAHVYNKLEPAKVSSLKSMCKMLNYMMGEPDNVSILDIAAYLKAKHSDATLADCNGQYFDEIKSYVAKLFETCNRIKPKQQVSDPNLINFMPQRYVFDNEILSNMYDPEPNSERAYPSGLDVFDALGIKSASAILDTLRPENKKWDEYGATREKMKQKFGNFDDWKMSNYNRWMQVLADMQKIDKDYPDYMKTSVWDAKNLNAALASWAEIKHDAILYAEQPFGAECGGGDELPSPVPVGYVEPNLNFWNTLLEAMEDVVNTAQNLSQSENNIYLDRYNSLKRLVERCRDIAQKEIKHQPLSDDDAWFIYTIGSSLEYFTLSVLDPYQILEKWNDIKGADRKVAVVADVYTRNILACQKQGILYEATGAPNQIFVLVEINGQLYITSGASFSYYEFVRPIGDRLTDEQWQEMIEKGQAPAQPDWFAPLLLDDKVEASETHCYSSGC